MSEYRVHGVVEVDAEDLLIHRLLLGRLHTHDGALQVLVYLRSRWLGE